MGIEIAPNLALEALTKDSDNTDDHEGEQINFRSGMGPNYERLEFIGDTFLKMATTISLFVKYASKDEYHLHVDRMLMLCNKNLLKTAREHDFARYVRATGFNR